MSTLPNDVLRLIFSRNDAIDECSLALVCKTWNDIAVGSSYVKGYIRTLPVRHRPERPKSELDITASTRMHFFIYAMYDDNPTLARWMIESDPRIEIPGRFHDSIGWRAKPKASRQGDQINMLSPVNNAIRTGHPPIVRMMVELGLGKSFVRLPIGLGKREISSAFANILQHCIDLFASEEESLCTIAEVSLSAYPGLLDTTLTQMSLSGYQQSVVRIIHERLWEYLFSPDTLIVLLKHLPSSQQDALMDVALTLASGSQLLVAESFIRLHSPQAQLVPTGQLLAALSGDTGARFLKRLRTLESMLLS